MRNPWLLIAGMMWGIVPGVLAQLPSQALEQPESLPHTEIPPPVELGSHYPWWVYLAGGVLLASLVVLVIWLVAGGKKQVAIPVKRPLQSALRALKALRAKADELQPADMGHSVSEILRQYYMDRYGIPAPFRTTQELFPPVRLEDEPLRRRHWRERFESLASLYDSLSYAPLPATKGEAVDLVDTAINKLEEERLNENSVVH